MFQIRHCNHLPKTVWLTKRKPKISSDRFIIISRIGLNQVESLFNELIQNITLHTPEKVTWSPSWRNVWVVPFIDKGFCPFQVSSSRHPYESGSCVYNQETMFLRLFFFWTSHDKLDEEEAGKKRVYGSAYGSGSKEITRPQITTINCMVR